MNAYVSVVFSFPWIWMHMLWVLVTTSSGRWRWCKWFQEYIYSKDAGLLLLPPIFQNFLSTSSTKGFQLSYKYIFCSYVLNFWSHVNFSNYYSSTNLFYFKKLLQFDFTALYHWTLIHGIWNQTCNNRYIDIEHAYNLHFELPLQLVSASVVLFLGFGVRICSAGPAQLPLTPIVTQQDQLLNQGTEQEEDEKLKQEFENWKSKTYALTVPLRVVSLQNSVPQSWVKDFMRSQGKRLKFQMNLCASIGGIFNNLSVPFNKVKGKSVSYTAADLVSVGDSWLSFAIKKRLIEPIAEAEDQDWFKCLCHKWKVTSLSLTRSFLLSF